MKPASRITDPHGCPTCGPGAVAVIQPHTVLTGMMPQARVTDTCTCVVPNPIMMGSFTVLVAMMPAARIGDPTSHSGAIALGYPTVLIGG